MTQEQKIELEYLIDILREASKWNVDQGDDALRLEVDLRINNILNGETTTDAESDSLTEESEVLTGADYQALEAAKLDEHLSAALKRKNAKERWKQSRVRVTINGHPTWKLESECHKEIIPGFEKKWHWVWNGSDSKQEQCDAMWTEHEQEANS